MNPRNMVNMAQISAAESSASIFFANLTSFGQALQGKLAIRQHQPFNSTLFTRGWGKKKTSGRRARLCKTYEQPAVAEGLIWTSGQSYVRALAQLMRQPARRILHIWDSCFSALPLSTRECGEACLSRVLALRLRSIFWIPCVAFLFSSVQPAGRSRS